MKNKVVDSQNKVADWIASIKQEVQGHKEYNIVWKILDAPATRAYGQEAVF